MRIAYRLFVTGMSVAAALVVGACASVDIGGKAGPPARRPTIASATAGSITS